MVMIESHAEKQCITNNMKKCSETVDLKRKKTFYHFHGNKISAPSPLENIHVASFCFFFLSLLDQNSIKKFYAHLFFMLVSWSPRIIFFQLKRKAQNNVSSHSLQLTCFRIAPYWVVKIKTIQISHRCRNLGNTWSIFSDPLCVSVLISCLHSQLHENSCHGQIELSNGNNLNLLLYKSVWQFSTVIKHQ